MTHPEEPRSAIRQLAADSATGREIATKLGTSVDRVWRIAEAERIQLQNCRWHRVVLTPLGHGHIAMLDRLAEMAQVSRTEMLGRIARVALEDDAKLAIRVLGKLARPKRAYRTRRIREAEERAALGT